MARKKINNESQVEAVRVGKTQMDMYFLVLKNIKFYPDMSDETLAFNADLHIVTPEEEIVCKCKNRGCGGCTDVDLEYNEDDEVRGRWMDAVAKVDKALHAVPDTSMIAAAKMYGWELKDVPTLSLESKVNNMIARWADSNGL